MRYHIEHLPMTIPMGVQSENNAEAVEFDVSDWLTRDGSLSFSVWVTRPGEPEAYQAANATLKDGVLYWWPTGADTAIAGEGRVEILAVSAKRRILSGWTATTIRETTTETTTEAPVNQRPWLDQALLASEEAKEAAASAAASADQAEGVVKKEVAALTQEMANTAPAIIPTATGSIVTITDGTARPAAEVISHIEPLQGGSGEASPSNVRPISGRTSVRLWHSGVNMLDMEELVQGDVDGSSPALRVSLPLASRPLVLAGKTYTVSFTRADDRDRMWALTTDAAGAVQEIFQNGANSTSAACTFTPTKDGYFTPLYGRYNAGNTGWDAIDAARIKSFKPYLKLGYQSEYTPYEGKTLSATLPETVYGGNLDWTTGMLTVDRQIVKLSDLTWVAYTAWNSDHTFCAERFAHEGLSAHEANKVLLEAYTALTQNVVLEGRANGFYVRQDKGALYISDARYTDAASFAAAVTGYAIYPLATPYSIQLTPQQLSTLKGTNNVWSDCGSTELSYIADTKLYIDQRISALLNA